MNTDIKIKTNQEGEKILVKTSETVLDSSLVRSELNRIEVEKLNIKSQVEFYKRKFNELTELEELYKSELKAEEYEDDLFDLE